MLYLQITYVWRFSVIIIMKGNIRAQALTLSIFSAMFFAVTFVLNRMMSNQGGSWIWASSFRFFWMLPILLIIVVSRKKLKPLWVEMRMQPLQWILWSTIGFGVFYSLLTFAASYGPSWLVASTFQVTIVAGMFLGLWINKSVPGAPKAIISKKALLFSLIILLGIVLMQFSEAKAVSIKEILLGTVPVIIAAVAYPLGNRKMMQVTNGKVDVYQRILGMTIASLPFWILLNIYGFFNEPAPTKEQAMQTLIIAVVSGVIATSMFFTATDRVRNNPKLLATVEATQSTEVVFALFGEILLLHGNFPDVYSAMGIGLVIIGMILHSRNH